MWECCSAVFLNKKISQLHVCFPANIRNYSVCQSIAAGKGVRGVKVSVSTCNSVMFPSPPIEAGAD